MNRNLIYDEYIGRIIEMQTEEGKITCSVLSVFRTSEDIDQKYIALIQMTEQGPTEDLYVYKFNLLEDGSPELALIESDDEYSVVSSFLSELLDEMEKEEANHHDHEDHEGCGCSCSGCGSHGCH